MAPFSGRPTGVAGWTDIDANRSRPPIDLSEGEFLEQALACDGKLA
jgi:hypothetical protein